MTTEDKLKIAEEALAYYANPSNWNEVEYPSGGLASSINEDDEEENVPGMNSFVIYVGGKKARETLRLIHGN